MYLSDAPARESLPPDLCVDLSQCTLKWIPKASSARRNVIEIKSPLLGIEMFLHFDQHSGAAGRFQCLLCATDSAVEERHDDHLRFIARRRGIRRGTEVVRCRSEMRSRNPTGPWGAISCISDNSGIPGIAGAKYFHKWRKIHIYTLVML